jgi:hypothetical protein
MSTADIESGQGQVGTGTRDYVALVYALVLIWGGGDVLSTFYAYAATGSAATETNPLVAALLSANPLFFILVKAAVLLCIGLVLVTSQSVVRRLPCWRLWFVAVVGSGIVVVFNNLAVGIAALS